MRYLIQSDCLFTRYFNYFYTLNYIVILLIYCLNTTLFYNTIKYKNTGLNISKKSKIASKLWNLILSKATWSDSYYYYN
jgi:hypothetical protein